jgi:hypothetical protein
MKAKLFLLSILIVLVACSKKDNTTTPPQTNNNNNNNQPTTADTVRVLVVCQGCTTIPSLCNVTLSGVINQPLAQWYSGGGKAYYNVPFGTIYYTGTHVSSVSGEFEVTATQKSFTIAIPD